MLIKRVSDINNAAFKTHGMLQELCSIIAEHQLKETFAAQMTTWTDQQWRHFLHAIHSESIFVPMKMDYYHGKTTLAFGILMTGLKLGLKMRYIAASKRDAVLMRDRFVEHYRNGMFQHALVVVMNMEYIELDTGASVRFMGRSFRGWKQKVARQGRVDCDVFDLYGKDDPPMEYAVLQDCYLDETMFTQIIYLWRDMHKQ